MCRVTVDGREARFNMKMDIDPDAWDVKSNKALGRTKDALEINSLIDNVKASLFQIYKYLQERGKQVTAEVIKNSFLGLNSMFETYLRTMGNCSSNTAAKYMRLFKKVILLAKNNGLLIR